MPGSPSRPSYSPSTDALMGKAARLTGVSSSATRSSAYTPLRSSLKTDGGVGMYAPVLFVCRCLDIYDYCFCACTDAHTYVARTTRSLITQHSQPPDHTLGMSASSKSVRFAASPPSVRYLHSPSPSSPEMRASGQLSGLSDRVYGDASTPVRRTLASSYLTTPATPSFLGGVVESPPMSSPLVEGYLRAVSPARL